jgi:hypothetical protein
MQKAEKENRVMSIRQYDALITQYSSWKEFFAAQPPQAGLVPLSAAYQVSDGSVIVAWGKIS